MKPINVMTYSEFAIPHLQALVKQNAPVMERIAKQLVTDVKEGRSLLVFGSGHSSIFSFELYHRAGGASFVIPVIADYLLPTAGPPVVRILERTPGVANMLLARVKPKAGEMIWLASQSGINAAIIDLALEARKQGLRPVAFTSVAHSSAVASRHPSGKRLFEICDEVVDLGGVKGDAAIQLTETTASGPLSSLGMITLGHSIIVTAAAQLERDGIRCVYTSVNTPEGEGRNKDLEKAVSDRDVLLR